MFEKIKAFSLVELMISLITISLITAALAPVITKKLSHGGITIGSFGGGSDMTGKSCPNQYYFQDNECKICPSGYFCNGTNKIPCIAGTYAIQGQTQCSECPEGYYSQDGAESCSENTATGCKEKSTTENICISCENTDDVLVDGNCVGSIPQYTYYNTTGTDVTDTQTEVSEDDNYWYIKVKSSGTFVFQTLSANTVDVFLVGSGAGGGYGGGGNTVTEKNVYVTTGTAYPITVGASVANGIGIGNTTSAFGLYAYKGFRNVNNSTCAFNEKTCDIKYGEVASSTNQIPNTGNGGIKGKSGMSGVVIIRGKIRNQTNITTGKIPDYTFRDTTGNIATTKNSTLSVDEKNNYWYLKLTDSGQIIFNSLPSNYNYIDIFVVGGGGGGYCAASGGSCGAGGGGSTVTEKDVYITPYVYYPITIGAEKASSNSGYTAKGNYSSGFGLYAYGGIRAVNHSICPFEEAECDVRYGNLGIRDNIPCNSNCNTGNGGSSHETGMSGIIILRGKLEPSQKDNASFKLPTYTYKNSSNVDIALTSTLLKKTKDYWYLKLTNSGTLIFEQLETKDIDVFLVGGAAGGGVGSIGCGGKTVTESVKAETNTNYPIVIGAEKASSNSDYPAKGNATSGFGLTAEAGSGKANDSVRGVCAFNDNNYCPISYGNFGSSKILNYNTGNAGGAHDQGMNGVVIIRGKL